MWSATQSHMFSKYPEARGVMCIIRLAAIPPRRHNAARQCWVVGRRQICPRGTSNAYVTVPQRGRSGGSGADVPLQKDKTGRWAAVCEDKVLHLNVAHDPVVGTNPDYNLRVGGAGKERTRSNKLGPRLAHNAGRWLWLDTYCCISY